MAVSQARPTLCKPKDCSPPDPSVHGILQARALEWVAIPFSRACSQPRDWAWFSHIAGRFFSLWATREAQKGRLVAEQGREPRALRLKVWCPTAWAVPATTRAWIHIFSHHSMILVLKTFRFKLPLVPSSR